jgi:hypothetical protein
MRESGQARRSTTASRQTGGAGVGGAAVSTWRLWVATAPWPAPPSSSLGWALSPSPGSSGAWRISARRSWACRSFGVARSTALHSRGQAESNSLALRHHCAASAFRNEHWRYCRVSPRAAGPGDDMRARAEALVTAELNRPLIWWDLFAWWHVAAMNWPTSGGGNSAHGGPIFAPWHRLYMRRLEQGYSGSDQRPPLRAALLGLGRGRPALAGRPADRADLGAHRPPARGDHDRAVRPAQSPCGH